MLKGCGNEPKIGNEQRKGWNEEQGRISDSRSGGKNFYSSSRLSLLEDTAPVVSIFPVVFSWVFADLVLPNGHQLVVP